MRSSIDFLDDHEQLELLSLPQKSDLYHRLIDADNCFPRSSIYESRTPTTINRTEVVNIACFLQQKVQ